MKWYDDIKNYLLIFNLLCIFFILYILDPLGFRRSENKDSTKEEAEVKAKISTEQAKIVSFWYTNLHSAHVFLHTCFDVQENHFNDQILNKAFNHEMTYYKLLFINFHNPSLEFQDIRDKIWLKLKEDKLYSNISLSGMLQNVPKKYFLFLKSFLNFEKIPAGYIKSYLLAFPSSLNKAEIEKVEIEIQERKYSLKKQSVLRKSWQEYFENPQENFWEKEGNR